MKQGKQNRDIYTEIGYRLRLLRDEKGLSLDQLSSKLKKESGILLSANMLGKIERGESRIQTDAFLAVCFFYKIDITYFKVESKASIIPESFSKLVKSPAGRDCMVLLSHYADKTEILDIILDFLRVLVPQMTRLNGKAEKETTFLKASSPSKQR